MSSESGRRRKRGGPAHELPHLFVGVDVRLTAAVPDVEESLGWDFVTKVDRADPCRKSPDLGEAS